VANPGPKVHFRELLPADINLDFIRRQHLWVKLSLTCVVVSLAVMVANAWLPSRGHALNWNVDFRGGSEITVEFAHPVEPGRIRHAMEAAGHAGAEVVAIGSGAANTQFQIRFGAASALSKERTTALERIVRSVPGAQVRSFEIAEAADRLHVRFDHAIDGPALLARLRSAGFEAPSIEAEPGPRDRAETSYQLTLASVDHQIRAQLESDLGPGAVKSVPRVESVGAKAGDQLRNDAAKALLGAVFLIMLYVLVRFDMRYAPAAAIGLLHDAAIMIGVFAVTYREVSLTTVAAMLTIVGFSMNDKIVVFDRIRELSRRGSGTDFRKSVNQALNQTLSRTIVTNSTVFFVTLAMNIFAVGAIREFAFAMNVGVVVCTYSSICIATPTLIYFNDRLMATQRPAKGRPSKRDSEPSPAH
jgi:preprotein translocase subunit SecF